MTISRPGQRGPEQGVHGQGRVGMAWAAGICPGAVGCEGTFIHLIAVVMSISSAQALSGDRFS